MTSQLPPLAFKPDLDDAARRWNAFFHGEIIDRPVVCVTASRPNFPRIPGISYRDRVFGDMEDVVTRAVAAAERTYWGGESIPSFNLSFGPDEIAVVCGAELGWSPDSGDTNWSIPCVDDWETALPVAIDVTHPLWQRMLALYAIAAEKTAGKMLLSLPDLHTNMDLLAAIRGPQRLCMDLIDCPELVDRAMIEARAVFQRLLLAVRRAGKMDEQGRDYPTYSIVSAPYLQCDFSCMMGPEMFRRWVLPALEEEAECVNHCVYHWDGPGALVHEPDLVASRGLYTLSYVPGDGHGTHANFIELFQRVQKGGKAVHVWGSPDEVKYVHRHVRPEKVFYNVGVANEREADELLAWFVRNT